MSSSEEERLVQMIEDFIESESPSPILSASSTCLPLNYHTQYLTLQVYMFFLVFIIYLFCWFPLCVCVCVCERETERERERDHIYLLIFVWFQEIVRSGTQAEAEILECVLRHMRNKRDAKKTTSLKKWLVMKHKIDGYNASLCQTSWLTSLGCPAGVSLSLSLSLYIYIPLLWLTQFVNFLFFASNSLCPYYSTTLTIMFPLWLKEIKVVFGFSTNKTFL